MKAIFQLIDGVQKFDDVYQVETGRGLDCIIIRSFVRQGGEIVDIKRQDFLKDDVISYSVHK